MAAPEYKCFYHQRGAVLLMSLIIMVVMTVISLSLMGNSTMEERMAANNMNKKLTFHASESASLIAIQDTAALSDAIVTGTDITKTINTGDSSIDTTVNLHYEGDAIPSGWSMGENEGSFVAYTVKALATGTKTNAHATSTTAQGIQRIGPKY